MITKRIGVLFLLCGFIIINLKWMSCPVAAQDSSIPLPSDLLFTVPETSDLSWRDQPLNRLVRVDAQTQKISNFYTDTIALEIRALSWSPQGDQLALYRKHPLNEQNYFPRELCIISVSGVLLICMQDHPSPFWAYENEENDYQVSWSVDEQTIVFVADREIEGDSRERLLVEADVNTGQTLRILYRAPYTRRMVAPRSLAWTSDLETVLVGTEGSSGRFSPVIVDLNTGIEKAIDTFVPENQQLSYVCPKFSPDDNYFAAYLSYDLDEYNPWHLDIGASHKIYHPVIMDRSGQIQASLGDPDSGELISFWGCPVWLPDSQSFFAQGWRTNPEQETVSAFIFQYFLATQQLVEYRPISNLITSALRLAPDNLTLTFSDPISPDVGLVLVVAVLFSEGEVSYFRNYDYSAFPIWMPLSLSPTQTPLRR